VELDEKRGAASVVDDQGPLPDTNVAA